MSQALSIQPPAGTKNILLSFPYFDARSFAPGFSHMHQTTVDRPFLPLGLLLWGATDYTYVKSIRVGNCVDGDANVCQSRIPGRYFEAGKTFEELLALAELGELEAAIEPRKVIQLQQAEPGVYVQVELEGPVDNLCFWGRTRTGAVAPLRASIEELVVYGPLRPDEKRESRFVGQLIDGGLASDSVIFEASGPSAEIVSTLLAAHASGYGRHRY